MDEAEQEAAESGKKDIAYLAGARAPKQQCEQADLQGHREDEERIEVEREKSDGFGLPFVNRGVDRVVIPPVREPAEAGGEADEEEGEPARSAVGNGEAEELPDEQEQPDAEEHPRAMKDGKQRQARPTGDTAQDEKERVQGHAVLRFCGEEIERAIGAFRRLAHPGEVDAAIVQVGAEPQKRAAFGETGPDEIGNQGQQHRPDGGDPGPTAFPGGVRCWVLGVGRCVFRIGYGRFRRRGQRNQALFLASMACWQAASRRAISSGPTRTPSSTIYSLRSPGSRNCRRPFSRACGRPMTRQLAGSIPTT